MTPLQLYEILSQMRSLAQQNSATARSILVSNPQLTKALFQVGAGGGGMREAVGCGAKGLGNHSLLQMRGQGSWAGWQGG